MDTLAHDLIDEHCALRLHLAEQVADAADRAWQDWIDAPAFERRDHPEAGQWLAHNRDVTRRLVARHAKAYACTVECSPIGRVYLLVGQA